MSTVAIQPETRIVIPNISWEIFEALGNSDCAGTRFAYDRGHLEIMSPSIEHEWFHKHLGRMIETLTEELNIPILSAGSTTLKVPLKQKGAEADECYYLTRVASMIGKQELDLSVDPPPDLALEVDICSSSLDKLGIYADIGVPELWIYDGDAISVYNLHNRGSYSKMEASSFFPFLDLKEIEKFMARFTEFDSETAWIRSFRDWVREQYGHLTR
ncbi:MAG: Uma2 family endonuclease [Pirellulales bacterium]|nr:Uma2 family endonuclease [Pirellulales bacterium]